MAAYCMINVLYWFEQGSELGYKCFFILVNCKLDAKVPFISICCLDFIEECTYDQL